MSLREVIRWGDGGGIHYGEYPLRLGVSMCLLIVTVTAQHSPWEAWVCVTSRAHDHDHGIPSPLLFHGENRPVVGVVLGTPSPPSRGGCMA
jgi:hypothetical protein